jgi:hypothetical protein
MKAIALSGILSIVVLSCMVLSCSTGDTIESLVDTKTEEETEDPPDQGNRDLFDDTLFADERAAWEAGGLRHYRFVITSLDSINAVPFSAEITVYPDREPEVVVLLRDKDRTEPYFNGKTIDAVYQRIAEDAAALKDVKIFIGYNQRYHYPTVYDCYPNLPDEVPLEDFFEIRISDFEALDG